MAALMGMKKCLTAILKADPSRSCSTNMWTHTRFYRFFSYHHHQAKKQVFFFENTEIHQFDFDQPYQTVTDIKEFGVRTVRGGFRRRPELIMERKPHVKQPGSRMYGLFDKCERIQRELTEVALRLLKVGEEGTGLLMLDIGCGHGWSLTLPSWSQFCVTGVDLDLQALSVVQSKINSQFLLPQYAHVVRMSAAHGLGFKENIFDVAISISFLQWLCTGKHSLRTLDFFFNSLMYVLRPGGKAAFQFYPRSACDVRNVISQAEKYFKGAIVSDFPHLDRGRKLFMILVNNK